MQENSNCCGYGTYPASLFHLRLGLKHGKNLRFVSRVHVQNELFRTVVVLAGSWSLDTVNGATAMPVNNCDDCIVSVERGGVVLVLSLWSHGCQQASGQWCT